jgi:hypothetical protein
MREAVHRVDALRVELELQQHSRASASTPNFKGNWGRMKEEAVRAFNAEVESSARKLLKALGVDEDAKARLVNTHRPWNYCCGFDSRVCDNVMVGPDRLNASLLKVMYGSSRLVGNQLKPGAAFGDVVPEGRPSSWELSFESIAAPLLQFLPRFVRRYLDKEIGWGKLALLSRVADQRAWLEALRQGRESDLESVSESEDSAASQVLDGEGDVSRAAEPPCMVSVGILLMDADLENLTGTDFKIRALTKMPEPAAPARGSAASDSGRAPSGQPSRAPSPAPGPLAGADAAIVGRGAGPRMSFAPDPGRIVAVGSWESAIGGSGWDSYGNARVNGVRADMTRFNIWGSEETYRESRRASGCIILSLWLTSASFLDHVKFNDPA